MKSKKLLLISLIAVLFFSSCNAQKFDFYETITEILETDGFIEEEPEESENTNGADNVFEDGFNFAYNGTKIYLGDYAENILTQLGPIIDFYEYEEGCVGDFNSIVKRYMYEKFDLVTRLENREDENEKECVYSIEFYDDSISTVEGLYIGQSYDDMVSIYGPNYQERQGFVKIYSYLKEGTSLSFGIKNDIIIRILYEIADVAMND